MKKTRLALTVILAIALVFTTFMTSFADSTADNIQHYPYAKQFRHVCCIGDSVATGYSGAIVLQENLTDEELIAQTAEYRFNTKDCSFAKLVSNEMGAEYESLTCVGLRCVDALYMLDAKGYSDYDIDSDVMTLGEDVVKAIKDQKNKATAAGGKTAIEKIKASDLILIQLGGNDAFANPFFELAFSGEPLTASGILNALVDGAKTLIKNYPKLLNRVKELNPDATIVVLDHFNPYDGLVLKVGLFNVEFGKAMSKSQALLHALYKTWAKKAGAVYVDVEGVTRFFGTTAINDPDFDFVMFDTHYGPDGHAFVYDRIMEALPLTVKFLSEPERGTLGLDLNGNVAGEYRFIKMGDGWIIKDAATGKYVCCQSLAGIRYRSAIPTIWQYDDGGFYKRGLKVRSILGFPVIVNGNIYLDYDPETGSLATSSKAVDTLITKKI